MVSIGSRFAIVWVIVIPVAVAFAADAEIPDGVSPGAVDHVAAIEGRCPSFSWGVVPGAERYQLVCYGLPEGMEPGEADLSRAEQVLHTEVPGAATSWTPNLSLCFKPGASYVWFVRAVFREERGEVVEASEWSHGRFFEIPGIPSKGDVEEALGKFAEGTGEGRSGGIGIDPEIRDIEGAGPERSPPGWRPATALPIQKSVPSAATAIRGSLSDTTGETYGVVGVSASTDGAGLGAANTAGGPDLVLDGSADLVPDTKLSQSGIDRAWDDPRTFNFKNSMGGGMTLQVEGFDVLTVASPIDAETLDGFDSVDFATDAELAAHAASADHDGRYFTESELSTSGGGGAIHWDNLTSVPADLADGDDDTVPIFPGSGWGLHVATTIDSADNLGSHTSITIGADGLPIISYHDVTNGALKVAHCSDVACTSATKHTVDSGDNVGYSTSITVGADGLPVISYYDYIFQDGDLKVAHCSNLECSAATIHIVDNVGDVGYDTSITVGTDGLPVISYRDDTNTDLKVAHCSDLACSSAITTTVDGVDDVGNDTSITVGADGLPVISHFAQTSLGLKVTHCSDLACTSATTTTIDSGGYVGEYTSITVGADGLPVVSYQDWTNRDLKVAHCSNLECTSATTATVDSGGDVGEHTSLTVGVNGLPLVSYYDASNNALKLAHCSDVACTSATLTTVDTGGIVGIHTSITIGADGLPVISYQDWANEDLKVAHCGNVFCIPYARPW
jgi:hypothetical protein